MANPFDHMDSFKALDPDTQSQIMSKFNSMAPEDQQTVMSKANTPMGARGLEPGAQDISTTPLVKGEFQKTGEDVSAKMMTKGMINANIDPYLAATVGTTIAMIPHVMAAMVGPKGAKTASEGADAIGEAVAESPITKAVMGTGKKEVAALTVQAAEAPIKNAAKSELANTVLKSAGNDIGKAEEAMHIDQSSTVTEAIRNVIKSPDNIAKFADKAGMLADKGADHLAQAASPETLQFYRKTAQAAINNAGDSLPQLSKNKLYNINKVFGDAIAKTEEGKKAGYDVAMSKYSDAMKVVNDLPKQYAAQKRALKLALVHAQNLANSQAPIRKAIGWTTAGAAAAGGAGLIKKELTGE